MRTCTRPPLGAMHDRRAVALEPHRERDVVDHAVADRRVAAGALVAVAAHQGVAARGQGDGHARVADEGRRRDDRGDHEDRRGRQHPLGAARGLDQRQRRDRGGIVLLGPGQGRRRGSRARARRRRRRTAATPRGRARRPAGAPTACRSSPAAPARRARRRAAGRRPPRRRSPATCRRGSRRRRRSTCRSGQSRASSERTAGADAGLLVPRGHDHADRRRGRWARAAGSSGRACRRASRADRRTRPQVAAVAPARRCRSTGRMGRCYREVVGAPTPATTSQGVPDALADRVREALEGCRSTSELYDAFVGALARALGKQALIALYGAVDDRAWLEAQRGYSVVVHSLVLERGIFGRALRLGVTQVATDARRRPGLRRRGRRRHGARRGAVPADGRAWPARRRARRHAAAGLAARRAGGRRSTCWSRASASSRRAAARRAPSTSCRARSCASPRRATPARCWS